MKGTAVKAIPLTVATIEFPALKSMSKSKIDWMLSKGTAVKATAFTVATVELFLVNVLSKSITLVTVPTISPFKETFILLLETKGASKVTTD